MSINNLKDVPLEGLRCVKCRTDHFRYVAATSIYANRCDICFEWMVPLTPENCVRCKDGSISRLHLKFFHKRLNLDI